MWWFVVVDNNFFFGFDSEIWGLDIGQELVLWLVNNVGVKKKYFYTIQTKKQTAKKNKNINKIL